MTKEEIEILKEKSLKNDHSAQTMLGKYYYEQPCSNNNLDKAEFFLKKAAEKHQKEANELLIAMYMKYMKYFIANNKNVNRINLCFELGVKWCKIGISTGFDFIKQQDAFVEEYAKAQNVNAEISLNHKLNKRFKKMSIIALIILVVLIVGEVLAVTLIPVANPIVYLIFLIPLVLLGMWIGALLYVIKINKQNVAASKMTSEDVKETFVDKSNIKNLNGMEKINSIFTYKNVDRQPITSQQRGLLGECFVYYLVCRKVKWFYELINTKLAAYNTTVKNIKWMNDGVETNDPYDFIIECMDNSVFYFDVKTTMHINNMIGVSTIEKEFMEKNKFLICKLNNFWFRNVDDFVKKITGVSVSFYDVSKTEDMTKLSVVVHEPTKSK